MNFLGTYSNGWGHLIVTIVALVCMTILLALKAVGPEVFFAVVSPVLLFWFGTGIGNTIAQKKVEQTPTEETKV